MRGGIFIAEYFLNPLEEDPFLWFIPDGYNLAEPV